MIKGERKDWAGGFSEVTSDKTWCLQAWRQAVAERALKMGRGTQAAIEAPSGKSFLFPKSIVFFAMSAATVLNADPRFMSIRMNSNRQYPLFVVVIITSSSSASSESKA